MRRGTTPKMSLHIEGEDLDGCQVMMTLRQDMDDVGQYPKPLDLTGHKIIFPVILQKIGKDIDVTKDDEDGCYVSASLTQEDTLKFATGTVKVQIRWIDQKGFSGSSEVIRTVIEPILSEGVMEYGQDES